MLERARAAPTRACAAPTGGVLAAWEYAGERPAGLCVIVS